MKSIRSLAVAAVLFVQFATLRAAEPGSSPDQPAIRVEKDVAYLAAERAEKPISICRQHSNRGRSILAS